MNCSGLARQQPPCTRPICFTQQANLLSGLFFLGVQHDWAEVEVRDGRLKMTDMVTNKGMHQGS